MSIKDQLAELDAIEAMAEALLIKTRRFKKTLNFPEVKKVSEKKQKEKDYFEKHLQKVLKMPKLKG